MAPAPRWSRRWSGWDFRASALLPCRYLSAGQKKRLGLARLDRVGRPLWLLDEPFAALDTHGRALAAELMQAHCVTGGIVVAASHDPFGFARALAAAGGGMSVAFASLLMRDLRLAARSGGSAALALAFFALMATLVPLGVGADLHLLAGSRGGVLWVGAVLAALLSLDRLLSGRFR